GRSRRPWPATPPAPARACWRRSGPAWAGAWACSGWSTSRCSGYRRAGSAVVGDPLNARLTDALLALGWPGGAGGPFDLLPLAIQRPGERPRLFELPPDVVLEVP